MATTLIGAMKTLFCLNRWNVEPRIETWTEAENIAFCTHVAYAIGKQMGLGDTELKHAVARTLLKSLNKHYLSDISAHVKDLIQTQDSGVWHAIVQEGANVTRALFPITIAGRVSGYLTLNGDYGDSGLDQHIKDTVEDLVRYCQYQVALSECAPNCRAFPECEGYKAKKQAIREKVRAIPESERFARWFAVEEDGTVGESAAYLQLVRNLKHVRRWNRMNRFVESSVLAHTFLVAFLAFLFSESAADKLTSSSTKDVQYHALLLALFHDVPEMLTGDIITPVKQIISRHNQDLLANVEAKLEGDLLKRVPTPIQSDIQKLGLFEEPSKRTPFSVPSLVKDCDAMGALLECAFEVSVGSSNPEITAATLGYSSFLQNSEWDVVREFERRIRYEQESRLF